MPSFRFTPIALALLLSGVLAYAAWNRPAPPPPREAPPVADAPPPPPRPTVWREVRDESRACCWNCPMTSPASHLARQAAGGQIAWKSKCLRSTRP